MTLLKPTIKINKLLVSKNGQWVVNLNFHNGLNIIRGENSAGKTTLLRFITYSLGSENIHFNQAALECDETFLEISANDTVITLRRGISSSTQQPLMIFWGNVNDSLKADSTTNWQQFPFRRSESKESFSQVLFRLLEMPELRGDSGSNITMHQLMRLIYSDQETPSGEIFRSEKFDPAITRAAVGDYLLGIDSNELYDLKINENTLEKELTEIKSGIRTIYNAFGTSGTEISLDFLNERILTLSSEYRSLAEKLTQISSSEQKNYPSSSEEDDRLRKSLSEIHSKLSSLKTRYTELTSEAADSELFLKELNERLNNIDESMAAEKTLGKVVFSFCPGCFSKLSIQEDVSNCCELCKSPISKDSAKSQLARMRNELALQLKESNIIRASQLVELESINRDIPNLRTELSNLERQHQFNKDGWRPAFQIELQNVAQELGSKQQEIKNTAELLKLAELLNTRTEKANEIEGKLIWVRGRIEAVKLEQTGRREKAYFAVANQLQDFLHNDLERQPEFTNADDINIDFGANKISVDDSSQFSASSMVYLRHSFHLSLLFASLKMPSFRYPRFVIIDGIEDGGMEPDRNYNFQDLIRSKSDDVDIEHQIIVATSQISPELNNETYTIGNSLTHNDRSILTA